MLPTPGSALLPGGSQDKSHCRGAWAPAWGEFVAIFYHQSTCIIRILLGSSLTKVRVSKVSSKVIVFKAPNQPDKLPLKTLQLPITYKAPGLYTHRKCVVPKPDQMREPRLAPAFQPLR